MTRALCAMGFFAMLSAAFAGSPTADVTAFTLPWDPASIASLRAHADRIDAVSPQWVLLKTAQGELHVAIDGETPAIVAARAAPMRVLPLVANFFGGVWDGDVAAALVRDAGVREAVLDQLLELARQNRFAGYVFDLENLAPATIDSLPAFVTALSARLRDAGLEMWLTVPVGDAWPLPALQKAGAGVVVMAYDQHWETSGPGPIAAADWFVAALERRLAGLDKSKVMVALASYAYDWPPSGRAKPLSIAQARNLAAANDVAISRRASDDNAVFRYRADDGEHEVWMSDAPSVAAQRGILRKMGITHVALWRLGTEDEGIWPDAAAPR